MTLVNVVKREIHKYSSNKYQIHANSKHIFKILKSFYNTKLFSEFKSFCIHGATL